MSPLSPREATRAMDKSPDAFRTISEVADDLDLPQHVLRFWETRFGQIKPLRRGGGRRYYRPDDVDLLKGIRHLLYGEGYTIRGVQRILKEDGVRFVQAIGRGEQTVEKPDRTREPGEDEPDTIEGAHAAINRHGRAPSPQDHQPSDGEGGREDAAAAGPRLAASDIERLRLALEELRECERVLGSLKQPGSTDEEFARRA